MKNIAIAIALLLVGSAAHAWEFPRNPDRFPSIGISADSSELDGSQTGINQTTDPAIQDVNHYSEKLFQSSVGADVRLPLADQLTISVRYSRVTSNDHLLLDGGGFRSSNNLSGDNVGATVRFYFN